MNKFFASIAVAASAFALASCSNDEPIVDGGANVESDGKMYTTLTLSLPQAGRSSTIEPDDNTNSNDGYEVGLDPENQVGSILVVLAKKDDNGNYEYVTSNRGEANKVSSTDKRPTYNMQFETRKLIDMVEGITDPASLPSVYVFAFCNPTPQLIEAAKGGFADGFVDAQGKITDASISINNNFLMANAETVAKQLPSEKDMNETYNTPDKPFFLGTVKVSRVTARFDFKQKITQGSSNQYPIYDYNVSDVDEDGNVQNSTVIMGYVTLTHLALMNEALEYYYLPRVSATETWKNPEICGAETPNAFVVSPWYEQKSAKELSLEFITNNYRSSVKEGTDVDFWTSEGAVFENLKYDAFADLKVDDNDDHTTWGDASLQDKDKYDYKIWKYVTENTIPGVNDQRKGITTGVVFKGYIEPAMSTDSELKNVLSEAKNPLYMYGGKLYGDFAMLKKFVLDEKNASSMLTEDFLRAYGIEETEEKTIKEQVEAIPDDSDVLTGKDGFTIYRPSDGKYPVYYPYYNRHNDNGNNTQMGKMEFATVRNNIYKLSINSILEFGHPGKPGDDPDPEDPNDPDETPKTYFRVQVKVLPWVVRVNNIDL